MNTQKRRNCCGGQETSKEAQRLEKKMMGLTGTSAAVSMLFEMAVGIGDRSCMGEVVRL